MNVVRGGVRKLVYDTDRPAILKGDLVGLYVDGNWLIGFETVVVKLCSFMWSEREWQVSAM